MFRGTEGPSKEQMGALPRQPQPLPDLRQGATAGARRIYGQWQIRPCPDSPSGSRAIAAAAPFCHCRTGRGSHPVWRQMMTTGTEAYLVMVVLGFVSFMGVLLYASFRSPGKHSDDR